VTRAATRRGTGLAACVGRVEVDATGAGTGAAIALALVT
jgi:hypothetical protein